MAAISEGLRQRVLDLVGRAYSTIALSKLSVLLGCSEEAAAQGEAAGAVLARLFAVCAAEEGHCGGPCVRSCSAGRFGPCSASPRMLSCYSS